MSISTYRIFSGGEEVTNVTGYPLGDEQQARDLAQEISAGQPGSLIKVQSDLTQPAGGWRQIIAEYIDGRPHPWVWTVTFGGPFQTQDLVRFENTDISYMSSGSELGPEGVTRGGLARHRLAVDAASTDEAIEKVRTALGSTATSMYEWTVVPGDDQSIRLRRDESE